jgi:hypothetical protein
MKPKPTSAAIVVAMALIVPASARAQFGYPAGYGGYGWGGWGSTIGGSNAAGLGNFNMGRGAYNEQTAVARSINTDTYLRWNQYMYLSQQHAANLYNERLRAEHRRVDKARASIQDQLRNHPETRDITDGDALNVLADELLNPNAGVSLGSIRTPLKPELIQQIPFKVASEGVTICIDQMTMEGEWPLALRVDAFKPERENLRKSVIEALEEDKKGELEPKTVEAVQAAIDRLRSKFTELVQPTNPDYIPAHDTIKAMAGLARMLYNPKIEEILAELEDYGGTTLGELLAFMHAYNLRFAQANSFRQRRIYMKLYPLLLEQANGRIPPVRESGSQPVAAAGAGGTGALGAAENLGSKAITGLKSAAVDFFKEMDWKHLSGTSSKAARQP